MGLPVKPLTRPESLLLMTLDIERAGGFTWLRRGQDHPGTRMVSATLECGADATGENEATGVWF